MRSFFISFLFIIYLLFEDLDIQVNDIIASNINNVNTTRRLRVAIAYWGMTRSTRLVYETHKQNLFNVLEEAEIDFTVYMHTWRAQNIVWADIVDTPVFEDEYILLNPSIVVIDEQNDFLNGPSYNLSMYWYESEWKRAGKDVEWLPHLVHNHVCALESLRRLTQLVRDDSSLDLVMYVRPDVRIDVAFEPNWLRVIHLANTIGNESVIALPNYDYYQGFNDRFAIVNWKDCEKYGSRLTGLAEYRKKVGYITSEKYLKHVVRTSFDDVMEIPFRFTIIRPNGKAAYT